MKPLNPLYIDKYKISVVPVRGFPGSSEIPKSSSYLLSALLRQGDLGKVTDYGSGPGFVSLALSRFCEEVYSLEWNLTAFRTLKENILFNGISNVSPSLSHVPNRQSDTVVINPNPHGGRELTISMIENSLKILKEDGSLYFSARRDFGAKWYQKFFKSLFSDVEVLDITGGYRTIRCRGKKKTETHDFSRKIVLDDLSFKTLPGVFSRKKIDEGTKILIENVFPEKDSTLIDFGSGYGAIGIYFSKKTGRCHLIENNLISIKCCKYNASINETGNCEVIFEDHIPQRLHGKADFFVSNPPTHFGGSVADFILKEAFLSLKKGGRAAFVVHRTAGYAQRMKHIFKNVNVEEKGFYSILWSEKCS